MEQSRVKFGAIAVLAAALLTVSQSAYAICNWYIDKTSPDGTELTLAVGQQYLFPYQVAVTTSKYQIPDLPFIQGACDGTVVDSFDGAPRDVVGTVVWPEAFNEWGNAPKVFNYSKSFMYDTCGDYQVTNTATAVPDLTIPEGLEISDSLTVTIHVPCVGGCSLTQGYWKTHSTYGPAPYDPAWSQIGEDTPFFLSGASWYKVLWTKPSKGNVYYQLAHQFIAAYLNKLNGADTAAINNALATAEQLLMTYAPSSLIPKTQFTSLAFTLDQYNNGYTGPGHCSE